MADRALTEIKHVRQIEGEPPRRWFTNPEMDLFVWYESDAVVGFQLCYDKDSQEKAVSWKKGHDLFHHAVDSGEHKAGHFKQTPLLVNNGEANLQWVFKLFQRHADELGEPLATFILSRLCVETL